MGPTRPTWIHVFTSSHGVSDDGTMLLCMLSPDLGAGDRRFKSSHPDSINRCKKAVYSLLGRDPRPTEWPTRWADPSGNGWLPASVVRASDATPTRLFGRGICIALAALIAVAAATQARAGHKAPAACHASRLPASVCAVIYRAAPKAGVKRRWAVSAQLASLVDRESSARFDAVNSSSGACGIGQMLPCQKYGPASCWPAPAKQAVCLLRYIRGRYHSPRAAWNHETATGWY